MAAVQEMMNDSGASKPGDDRVTLREVPVRVRVSAERSGGREGHRGRKGQGQHQLLRRIHALNLTAPGIRTARTT